MYSHSCRRPRGRLRLLAAKRAYDGWRPISAIRYLVDWPVTDSRPLCTMRWPPLITNLIELVSTSSVASGRHAGLTPGKIAVSPGWSTYEFCQPAQRREMDPRRYLDPYQRTNFVTPAFPANFSGHSTFSRSENAAESLPR